MSSHTQPVNVREAKKLASARLRNPQTPAAEFARIFETYWRLCKRGRRRRKKEQPGIQELVLQIEAEQRANGGRQQ